MRYSSMYQMAVDRPIGSNGVGPLFFHGRRQMAAGQGGFHIGALRRALPSRSGPLERFGDADFLYAYDCGSDPKRHVRREIDALLAGSASHRLDLLVLSHFDRDHICGTPHLLRRYGGFAVDTIMLPFVDMDERIVALAQAAHETEGQRGAIDRFFIDMVFDPEGTLTGFGPRRILFIQGPDDGPLGRRRPDVDPDGGDFPIKGEFGARSRAEAPFSTILFAADDGAQGPYEAWTERRGTSEIVYARHAALGVVGGAAIEWKFAPWVRHADPADVAIFRAIVEHLFGWSPGAFDIEVRKPAARRQMVTTKRTALARAYRAAFLDKNLTSLCLYSGPRHPDQVDAAGVCARLGYHRLTKIGWLGTGDAHLKDPRDIAELRRGLARDLPYVATYLFPHHGSIENSDPDDLIVDAEDWVAAADPIHPWAHPHWRLQGAVSVLGHRFHHVRAAPLTAFEEWFVLAPSA